MNFYMNKLDCIILELINMLVITEGTLKSSRDTILAIERTSSFKRKFIGKKKAKSQRIKRERARQRKMVLRWLKQGKSISIVMLKATGGGTILNI